MFRNKILLLVGCFLLIISGSGCETKRIYSTRTNDSDSLKATLEDQSGTKPALIVGEEITIHTKDKAKLRMILTEANATSIRGKVEAVSFIATNAINNGEKILNDNLTGSYISTLTGDTQNLPLEDTAPVVQLAHIGNKIAGSFDGLGMIWGDIDGDTIKFDWFSWDGSGKGKWTFKPGSNEVVGTWNHGDPSRNVEGAWNLMKTGREVEYFSISSTMIKRNLVPDETALEIKLEDIESIEVSEVTTSEVVPKSGKSKSHVAGEVVAIAGYVVVRLLVCIFTLFLVCN